MKLPEFDFHKLPPVVFVYNKAKQIILPGVNGASLYDVGKFFIAEASNVDIMERADLVTFNFILAIPPTFLFLFSLVPYLPLGNVEQTILRLLRMVTPNDKIYLSVQGVVSDFMNKQHHSVLSFGILLTLYYSSSGMGNLIKSFDRSLVLYKKRGFIKLKWTAIKLTVMLLGVFLVTIAVMILQNASINVWLMKEFHNLMVIKATSIAILVLLVFFTISIIYTYGPSLTHKFSFISAGSVFATLACLTLTFVFFFLVNNFLNYNKIYGSIGTLIAFMAWLWYNTLILLVGFELNVSLLLGKLSHEKKLEVVV